MPACQSDNTKRIAKNTILLYFRMLFLMCISLYTSRVILDVLGVVDYGIYNVVGGFVSMFALISAALTSACSRFLNFEMGRGADNRLQPVFSTSLLIHIALAVIIAILCESVGVWYLNSKMVIPVERMSAANWVFQISIFNFCLNLITVPFNAAIIAHEKMSIYAYVSIVEGILRLLICYLVYVSSFDRLITYAFLYMLIQFCVMSYCRFYCRRHFSECHLQVVFDRELIKQMFSYSGWHLFGNSASILNRQGVDLVLNYFCGPVLNAAKGVSNQVANAVTSFANNFMTALNPQITQSYARRDFDYMFSLVFRGSKFSFFLLYFLSLPIIINADFIIHLWLKEVPDYAIALAQLALVSSMITSISNPLVTSQNATGNVRNYQIIVGGLQLLNLPTCFIVLKFGVSPLSVMVVAISFEICCLIARLLIIPQYLPQFSSKSFVDKVMVRIILVAVSSAVLPIIMFVIMPTGFLQLIIVTSLCLVSSGLSILFMGCTKQERLLLISATKKFLKIH